MWRHSDWPDPGFMPISETTGESVPASPHGLMEKEKWFLKKVGGGGGV